MASIEFVAKAQADAAAANSGATGAEITHGLTIGSGDLLVAFFNRNNSTTVITIPTGWTEIKQADGAETSRYSISYRIAGSNESTAYEWTMGVDTSWDVHIRQFRVTGSNLYISEVKESTGTAAPDASITSIPVPGGAIAFVHVQTDTSATYVQSVDNNYVELEQAAVSSRYQASAHQIVQPGNYELAATTITASFNSGSTVFEANHFYISFTFAKANPAPALIRRPWTKQPQGIVGIDRSNALGQSCVFAWAGPQMGGGTSAAGQLDLVSGQRSVVAPNGSSISGQSIGAFGHELIFTNNAQLNRGFEWTNLNLGNLAYSGYTVVMLGGVDDGNGFVCPVSLGTSTGHVWALYKGDSGNGGRIYIDSTLNTAVPGSVVSNFWSEGAWNQVLAVSGLRNDGADFYRDGVGLAVNQGAHGTNIDGEIVEVTIGSNDTWFENFDGRIASVFIFNKRFNAAEHRQIADNPWQIFKSQTLYIGKPDDRRVVVF